MQKEKIQGKRKNDQILKSRREAESDSAKRHLTFDFCIFNFEFRKGFTMIETVVVLAIVTAISAQVLFNFGGLNEGAALNRSRRELALAIRRAQNTSLAVSQISVGNPPVALIPLAAGVRLSSQDPSRYFLFADLTPRDEKYTGTEEKVANTERVFERNVRINRLLDESRIAYPTIHILFAAPEAYLTFTDANGAAITTNLVEIELVAPSGQAKRITVRANGQINMP